MAADGQGTSPRSTTPDNYIKDNRLAQSLPPESTAPNVLKLPVITDTGKGIVLDDRNVSLNPLFPLDKSYLLSHYRPQPLWTGHFPIVPIQVSSPRKTRWRLGLHAGTSASLTDIEESIAGVTTITNRDALIRPTLGLKLERVGKRGLLFSTGLNLLSQGFQTTVEDRTLLSESIDLVEESQPIFNAEGELVIIQVSEVTRQIQVTNTRNVKSLQTLEVPLLLGYQTIKSRWDLSVSAGLGLNFLSGIESILNVELSGLARLQIGYAFNDRFRLYGQATGGRFLSEVDALLFGEINLSEPTTKSDLLYGRLGLSYTL